MSINVKGAQYTRYHGDSNRRARRAPGILATALLCAIALSQPNLAYAGSHGEGEFHGDHEGGFHGDHDGRFDGDHDRRFDDDHDRRFDDDRFRREGFFGGFYGDPRWRYYCSDPKSKRNRGPPISSLLETIQARKENRYVNKC